LKTANTVTSKKIAKRESGGEDNKLTNNSTLLTLTLFTLVVFFLSFD